MVILWYLRPRVILSTGVIYRCPARYDYREIAGTVGYYTCNLHVRLEGWHREIMHVVCTLGKIYKGVMLYLCVWNPWKFPLR